MSKIKVIREETAIDYYPTTAAEDLLALGTNQFSTVLADPPWRFQNRTGKVAPEHKRLSRYGTMSLEEIMELPVAQVVKDKAHLYLWVPNALIAEGLEVMRRWGFTYKTNLVWYKIRKDGGPGWTRRRLLFPQRHGDAALRDARLQQSHAVTRPHTDERHSHT